METAKAVYFPKSHPVNPTSKFRIGQVVEGIGHHGEDDRTSYVTGVVEQITMTLNPVYRLRDEDGENWWANEFELHRPLEVPPGWEPKESK